MRAAEQTELVCATLRRLVTGAAALTLLGAVAVAQQRKDPGEIRGLKLGQIAAEMTVDGFGEFACGGNGGPVRQPIEDWSEFKKCRPEPGGLHEVAVRFDDSEEYVGKAIDDPMYTRRRGTRVAGHPVLLSVLFDTAGIARGIRFLSDPRGDRPERRMAHLLRLAVMSRYGAQDWKCEDLAAADGETPIGGVFIKQRCEKINEIRAITVQANFFRRPGQADIDPVTKLYRPGQFDSWTRVEILDPRLAAK